MKGKMMRKAKGQCLIEVTLAAIFFIPVVLMGMDLLAVTLANSVNDHLAKDAARAAANQQSMANAQTAAIKAINALKKSTIIENIEMVDFQYQSNERVSVTTRVHVKLPAPFAFMERTKLIASATEPIVGTPVDL